MTDVYIETQPAPPDQSAYQEPFNVSSPKLEASRVIAAGRARLVGITVYSSNVASQFIQLHDASTLPADTAVPVWVQVVAATGNLGFLWIPGRVFEAGIVICNSSTAPTKTIGAADCFFDAQWTPIT